MTSITQSALTSAATCFLKGAEALDKAGTVGIVGQKQYGQNPPGHEDYQAAIRLYNGAAEAWRDAGLAYAAEDYSAAEKHSKRAVGKWNKAERHYKKGYRTSCGR